MVTIIDRPFGVRHLYRRDERVKKFIHFFTKTQTGRAAGIALIILGIAYGAKQYYTYTQETQRTKDARDANSMLTAMADSLEAHLEEDEASLEDFEARSEWFPADMACGADATFPEPEGVWKALGVEAASTTRFQFRFQRSEGEFTLIARRDTDCDGLYYVVTQTSKESMTGGFYRRSTTQNANE